MVYNFETKNGFRKFLLLTGVLLLAVSFLIFLGCLINLFEFETFEALGHSGIRTIAAIAVIGCLLGAISSWDD